MGLSFVLIDDVATKEVEEVILDGNATRGGIGCDVTVLVIVNVLITKLHVALKISISQGLFEAYLNMVERGMI